MLNLKASSVAAACAAFALLVACAGGAGDTSSPLRVSGAPSRVLTSASSGRCRRRPPNQGEVEVCKYGTDASFSVSVDGGQASTFAVTAGTCKVVALDFSTNQTAKASWSPKSPASCTRS